MRFRLVLFVLFLVWSALPARSAVRTATSDGEWEHVAWVPAGLPQPGDTVVVEAQVLNMPAGTYGALIIRAGASLTVPPGVLRLQALRNDGDLRLLPGAVVKLEGDLVNSGSIRDGGTVEMVADGGVISGGGSVGNLVLNAGVGSVIRTADSLSLETLYVAAGELRVDSNNLNVDADFASPAPFAGWSVTATTGIISLNGRVYGSARGPLRLGWITGGGTRRHPTPPATCGMLGGLFDTVRFAASRTVSFSRFVGTVVIDSGAVVTAEGIGTGGVNTIEGTVLNYGRLTAADERHHWRIEGDLINRGAVDRCIVLMTGHDAALRTDSGTWGSDAGLKYRAASGGRLELHGSGSLTLPLLEVATLSAADSGVVVDAGNNELLIRHRFVADRARGCRLVSDTLVRLRNDAEGIILADVSFEGFYDSEIGGMFGGIGRKVTLAMPKRFVRPVSVAGTFVQRANAPLTIRATTTIPPGTVFAAEVVLDTGGVLVTEGDLTILRGMRGGGRLEMIGSAPTLDVRHPLADSLLVQVGRDTAVTALSIVRSCTVPRMTVHPGSAMLYPPGVSVNVTGEFRYRIAVEPGCSMMCAAVRPADPSPAAVFPGADSVFAYSDSLGYVPADTIRTGQGYWVMYAAAAVIEQRGTMLNPPFLCEVADGWNILGGAGVPVDVADMVELLAERTSSFFEFMTPNPTDGYGAVTTLQPGKGYLVRFSGAGFVVGQ